MDTRDDHHLSNLEDNNIDRGRVLIVGFDPLADQVLGLGRRR